MIGVQGARPLFLDYIVGKLNLAKTKKILKVFLKDIEFQIVS